MAKDMDMQNKTYLDFFELLFTDDVHQLKVDEAIRFERQPDFGNIICMINTFIN